ncbi:MAG: signal recognition particle protein [Pseudomonadota bacterium]|nr:signal recognition particle protein [Pseudomonadota bacterium]
MFDTLSDRLGDVFGRLKKRGALTEEQVNVALREVRVALLEADVALPVAKDFISNVQSTAIGSEVLKSVTPAQMVVKIVHDQMVELLGKDLVPIRLASNPPSVIMMVGLQGAGKTTTAAKLAYRLENRDKKKTLLASLDVYRPAAQQQLAVLGQQAGVSTLPVVAGQQPVAIAERAMQASKLGGYDVVLLDTAGRQHVNEVQMTELSDLYRVTQPVETLLVADSLIGQDAVNMASGFQQQVDLTGLILTRVDGDGRGGAALSARAVTGCPIKFMGVGEGLDALEEFHPGRIASRILGMGDVVSLVEKAQETFDEDEAAELAVKVQKGVFDLEDFATQIAQIKKMGGLDGLLSMLPGVGKVKKQLETGAINSDQLIRQEAIIRSMTMEERRNAKLLNSSRKRRIAAGSGTTIQDVNRLLKQYKDMQSMLKRAKKMGKKGLIPNNLKGLMPAGFPPQ